MKLLSDQITPAELAVVLQNIQICLDNNILGDIVEFGCYVGTTSVHLQKIALAHNRALHVYDSFEGLPEKSAQDDSPAGLEFKQGELFASKKQLILNFKKAHVPLPIIHKGWFSNLTTKDIPKHLCFAFLDGDFYESISDSLRLVWPHISKDGLVLVHDYGRVTLPGAKRAVDWFITNAPNAQLIRAQEHIAIIKKL